MQNSTLLNLESKLLEQCGLVTIVEQWNNTSLYDQLLWMKRWPFQLDTT